MSTIPPTPAFDPATEASRALQGFVFSRLTPPRLGIKVDHGIETEIWRCQRPDSTVNAFDVAVTVRGIAVLGDFDGILFRGGIDLNFLAGDDVTGHIYSKVNPQCRDSTFDRDDFFAGCAAMALTRLDAVLNDARLHSVSPDFVVRDATLAVIQSLGASIRGTSDFSGTNALTQLRFSVLPSISRVADCCARLPVGVLNALESIEEFLLAAENLGDNRESTADDVDRLFTDRGLVSDHWPDGLHLEAPSESLLFRLHLVNQAAKAIVTIKARFAAEPEAMAYLSMLSQFGVAPDQSVARYLTAVVSTRPGGNLPPKPADVDVRGLIGFLRSHGDSKAQVATAGIVRMLYAIPGADAIVATAGIVRTLNAILDGPREVAVAAPAESPTPRRRPGM